MALESGMRKYSAAKLSSNSILERFLRKKSRIRMPQMSPPIQATRSNTLQQLRMQMVVLSDRQTVMQVLRSPEGLAMSETTLPTAAPKMSLFKLKGRMLLSVVRLLESIWYEIWLVGEVEIENLWRVRPQAKGEEALLRLTAELAEQNSTEPQLAREVLQPGGQVNLNCRLLQRVLTELEPPSWKQELRGRQLRDPLVHRLSLLMLPGSIEKWSEVQVSKLRGTLVELRLVELIAPFISKEQTSNGSAVLGQLAVSMLTLNPIINGAQLESFIRVLRVIILGSQEQLSWVLDMTMPQFTICSSLSTKRMTISPTSGSETRPPQTLLQARSPCELQKLSMAKRLELRIRLFTNDLDISTNLIGFQ